jgi:hypothetical protein
VLLKQARQRPFLALIITVIAVGLCFFLAFKPTTTQSPEVTKPILHPDLVRSSFWLSNLHLGASGRVYGARKKSLHRIEEDGTITTRLYQFHHQIQAIHEHSDELLLVATDRDYWDPDTPSRLYKSVDGGKSFELIKAILGGSFVWWSLATDSQGTIFAAEYGPQGKAWSKTLWRSNDNGVSWDISFKASERDKIHLHRIAVDPYTDDIWLTVGDGLNRQMLSSQDHGDTWEKVAPLQATSVAFSKAAIYWGKDEKGEPGVTRFDRETRAFAPYFDPREYGDFGGSIYDMTRLPSGDFVIPFMKYPNDEHKVSVWFGSENQWQLLLEQDHSSYGLSSVAGPDTDGWVYLSGYQFRAFHHAPSLPFIPLLLLD